MKRKIIILLACLSGTLCLHAAVTIEQCLQQAEQNYPLIASYGLIERTTDLSLSEINRGWLPNVTLYGQGTVQNIVPSFPDALSGMMTQLGNDIRGLGHVQYKTGIDLNQTVWDGGASKAQRSVQRATAEVERAALDVQLYAVREKVQALYFGALLLDQQIAEVQLTVDLLEANLKRVNAMVANGTAMQSDADMIEARLLTLRQQMTEAQTATASYRCLLGIYTGENIENEVLVCPEAVMPDELTSQRPELRLFEERNRLTAAQNSAVTASLMPKIGLFAQAYYGYPGFNYFESMMNRKLSANLLAGIKVSWNLDALYRAPLSRRRLAVADARTAVDRDVFLFNTGLQTSSQTSSISGLRKVIRDDARIVELRVNVRKAAESQLLNGVIDATALLTKITDESQARLAAVAHDIQLRQNIFQLKLTLNR